MSSVWPGKPRCECAEILDGCDSLAWSEHSPSESNEINSLEVWPIQLSDCVIQVETIEVTADSRHVCLRTNKKGQEPLGDLTLSTGTYPAGLPESDSRELDQFDATQESKQFGEKSSATVPPSPTSSFSVVLIAP